MPETQLAPDCGVCSPAAAGEQVTAAPVEHFPPSPGQELRSVVCHCIKMKTGCVFTLVIGFFCRTCMRKETASLMCVFS